MVRRFLAALARPTPLVAAALTLVSLEPAARAQQADDGDDAEAAPAPAPRRPPVTIPAPPPGWSYQPVPPSTPLPPNVRISPDGSTVVTRTPAGGADVHANTPAGVIHAYGCDRVELDPSRRTAAPCPYASPAPAAPYPYAYPYAYPYPHPYPYPYAYAPPQPAPPAKPKYAPDPARSGALIASSLVFGLGTAAAGAAFVASAAEDRCDLDGCHGRDPSRSALVVLGAAITVPPSIPRLVVGDVGIAALYTSLRVGSFVAGTVVDWKDDSYVLPVTLAFVAPLTLGIIDLATTPHREQLADSGSKQGSGAKGTEQARHRRRGVAQVQLDGVAPTAAVDRSGSLVPAVAANGRF